jgi:creatinine amidohydrolase
MKYGDLKRTDIEAMDKTHKVVVVPLGSLEQHGPHLPLRTDSMIGGELADRVEAALPDTVLQTPTQWLGSSDHHLTFPGTISLPSDLYIDVVCRICECILSAGFRRIFLHLSHGGNDVPCKEAIYRLSMKHRDRPPFWIASAGWWGLADDVLRLPEMATSRPTHACEYETSMVLALRGELVDMTRAAGERMVMESRYYIADLLADARSKVNVSLPFERMTRTGAIGRPDLGTADKGRRLLDVIAARIVDFVREFSTWDETPRLETTR